MVEGAHHIGEKPLGCCRLRVTSRNQEVLGPHIRVDEYGEKNPDSDLIALDTEMAQQILNLENHPEEVLCNIGQVCIL